MIEAPRTNLRGAAKCELRVPALQYRDRAPQGHADPAPQHIVPVGAGQAQGGFARSDSRLKREQRKRRSGSPALCRFVGGLEILNAAGQLPASPIDSWPDRPTKHVT